jgi:uncharacterized protein
MLSLVKKISLKWLVVYVACVALLLGGRGYVISRMVGGVYPWSACLFDAFALLVLLGVLRGLDHIFQKAVRYGLDRRGWGTETRVQVARFAFILLFLLPFLLVTFQIHPQRIATTQDPGDLNLPFEEVELNSMGTVLKGWYVPGDRRPGPVVLVTHGLGANKQNFMYPMILTHKMGLPALIVDFRAHGDSGGAFTTFGLLESHDIKTACDWLVKKHPGQPIYALSYSMGGAAVALAQAEYGLFNRIVIDSTFTSLRSMAQKQFLRFFGPLDSFAWCQARLWAWFWAGVDLEENSPEAAMHRFRGEPVLLIHGKSDSLIPYTDSVRLKGILGGTAELWLIDGAGHAETMFDSDYEARLRKFFGIEAQQYCK